MSAVSKILIGLGGLVFAGIVMIAVAPKKAHDAAASPPPAEETNSPAQLEKEQLYRNSTAGAASLRRAMKDPSTFELVSSRDRGEGIVCYQYKAKNSFGALLPDSAVLTSKGTMLLHAGDGNKFVGYWNKHCTQPGGTDTTGHVQTMLSVMK